MWKIVGKSKSIIYSNAFVIEAICECCGEKSEFIVNNDEDILKRVCDKCGNINVHNIIVDNSENLKYRLKRIWKRLKNKGSLCTEWDTSYDIFESWALKNGYKDWKNIKRRNIKIKYRPSNCYWVSDRIYDIDKGMSGDLLINKLNSNIYTRIETIKSELVELSKEIVLLDGASNKKRKNLIPKIIKGLEKTEKCVQMMEQVSEDGSIEC